MSNMELVEEYPKEIEMTMFEKVIMASKRAKDLHRGQNELVDSFHRDTYVSIEEINKGYIKLEYREEAPAPMLSDAHDGDEEEDA